MELFDLILHIDTHLQSAIQQLGALSYIILFLTIFIETGLVVVPFLPGDSLLFAAGTLAGSGMLDIRVLIPLLVAASIAGDNTNYWIGRRLGRRVFAKESARVFKPQYLKQTQEFYARHGGKTIILARFVPIIRTFAPFVAGVGHMRYKTFFAYSIVGALTWVISLTGAGYFFGSIPAVRQNFEYVVILIVLISLLPALIEFIRHQRSGKVADTAEATDFEELEETFEKERLS